MEKTNEELADILVQETIGVSKIYMELHRLKDVNKESWAWLHTGFMLGMVALGKKQPDAGKVIDLAITKLKAFEK